MQKRKHPIVISLTLLACAMLLLAGCSFKNEPVVKEPEPEELPLDRLKKQEAEAKAAAEKKTQATTQPTTPQPNAMNAKQYSAAPAMSIDQNKTYTATLRTDKGDIVIQLNGKETPVTANNFIFLAREKFYDGTIFHRTIDGFMIQGGDPQGTGMGGPGYRFDDEEFSGEYTRGTVAMANAGPDTNGSQFFIMHADYSLPKNYVIFGTVTSGIEVVDAIATAPVTVGGGGENSKPVTPIKIQSIEIAEQ